MTKPPGFADYFAAITDSTLPATDKGVCFGILRFRSSTDGTCYPSVATLARAASLTPRTVGKVLHRLAERRVVEYVKRSKGGAASGRGIPHTLRLDLDALRALKRPTNPEPRSELGDDVNPEPRGTQPRTSRPSTPNLMPANPEPRSDKPSIHPTSEPTIQPSDGAKAFASGRWMDGASTGKASNSGKASDAPHAAPSRREAVYAALQSAGVRGANADHLANVPDLTAETVHAENRRIRADRNVGNPPAALVRVLANRHGLTLRGRERPRPIAPMDPAILALQRQIAAKRSQLPDRDSRPIGDSIASIASRLLPPPGNP